MKLLVDGMIADIARLHAPSIQALDDLREGWSAMLKGASAAEVLALCRVLHSRLPPEHRWLADDLVRHHPEAGGRDSPPITDCSDERQDPWAGARTDCAAGGP